MKRKLFFAIKCKSASSDFYLGMTFDMKMKIASIAICIPDKVKILAKKIDLKVLLLCGSNIIINL